MSHATQEQDLARRVAAWSDEVQAKAVSLADRHRDLLPRRISRAQLSGLQNIVHSAPDFQSIRRFLDHQAQRAARAGRADAQAWWQEIRKVLDGLDREGQVLRTQVGMGSEKEETDRLHRFLTREYVQHLVCHCLWLASGSERRKAGTSRS